MIDTNGETTFTQLFRKVGTRLYPVDEADGPTTSADGVGNSILVSHTVGHARAIDSMADGTVLELTIWVVRGG